MNQGTMSLDEQLNHCNSQRRRRRRITLSVLAVVVAAALIAVGFVVVSLVNANNNVMRSGALAAVHQVPKLGKDTNILVMGLDSRVDEMGQPLSSELYDALDAGDQSVGGYNANVLMLIHIPADGSKATAISIPRDDYVELSGIPGGSGTYGKIKEAYGDALSAEQTALLAAGKPNDNTTYQQARDAGRAAEIDTVSAFLGNVHVDNFVEVTMAAFYEVAQAVAPITVCTLNATQDTYSGANFTAGLQQIDAKQAMAYVRQRRDTSDPSYAFSDLDRERRQQAFVVDVIHQLKQAGTFTNIPKMETVLNAVSSNIVVNNGLNLITLIQQATSITGGNIAFTTLPISGFGTAPNGESINLVNLPQVQATVQQLLAPAPVASPTAGAGAKAGASSTTAAPGTASAKPSAPATTAAPATATVPTKAPADATTTYSDWTGSLAGGTIPCVK
ncbi:LCP family protein [Arthrobacter sp.]|uniref:LCP family protein n=1 Tax=Arthrobacter sp. TaxID=1667 RepID=UPI0026E0CE33|nr:LCP family protein [Arthrobacter sp.]MDO5753854.1 LCP family protein [Arthrobacter sp.]